MRGNFKQSTGRAAIFSPFFYPEAISTGKYNTFLARALAAKSWKVDIIASHPLYPDWKPKITGHQLPQIRVTRGGAWIRYPRGIALRRIVLEMWFIWHATAFAFRHRNVIDIAICVFPPVFFAVFLQWIMPKQTRIVGIVHDLQGQMMGSGVVTGKGAFARLVSKVEGYVLRRCDKVICLSKSMANVAINNLGVEPRRCVVRYPFATEQKRESRRCLSELFEEGRIHVVYSGALGNKQMPTLLLRFFEELCRTRADIVCHIFSRGPIFQDLVRARDGLLKERVRFHDLVPEEDLEELYARSDIQIIPQAVGTGAAAFPSKLPNLMAAGVPIFAVCESDSELAQVICESCVGVHAPAHDTEFLVKRFIDFIEESKREARADRRSRLRSYVDQFFSVNAVVESVVSS